MRRLAGQAVRHTGRVVHALVQFALAVVLTSIGLLAVLTWRLSQGPLELPWLAARLEQAVNQEAPAHVTLGNAALTWEGFSAGVDRPLDIRVRDVVVTDAAGTRIAAIPRAEVSLSTSRLLIGRLVPRAIEVDGARLRVVRAADGGVTLDLGGLFEAADQPDAAAAAAPPGPPGAPGSLATSLLREFVRPAVGDRARAGSSHWSQLRHVRIRDAALDVTDRQLGAAWALHGLGVDLERGKAGGVTGRADADFRLGGQVAHLAVTAQLDAATGQTGVTASLGQIVPAGFVGHLHGAEALAPLDVPVALSATVQLDPELTPTHASARADLGAGALRFGQHGAIVLGGAIEAEGTEAQVALRVPRLELAPRPDGRRTVVQAHADLVRGVDGAYAATGALDLDQVAFADLPTLWPEGMGGAGARPWVTQNITDGIARNGHVDLGFQIAPDFSDVAVTKVEGGIDGQGVTVHWLRPVPPIEDATARLSFAGADALAVTVSGGHQAGLRIRGGKVLFSGLNEPDQFADIEGDIAGPVADLLTLLRHPRVKLLDRSPLPVTDASGDIAGRVTVTHLPLRDAITMDDVNIRASAKTTDLRLAGIAAGHDLDHGELTLDAGPEGLHAAGGAALAGLPVQLQLDLDFRAGPPTEILQKVTVNGTADAKQLAALGLDAPDVLGGTVGGDATLSVRRNGLGEATLTTDLAQATLTLAPLGFSKPRGRPATLSATVQLDGSRIAGIAPIRLEGEGVHLDASATFDGGRPTALTLRHLALGDDDASGEVQLPRRPGDPWRVSLTGASFDVSSQLERKPAPEQPPGAQPPPPGPAYIADARFDRLVLGKGRWIADVVAHAENDGRLMRRASLNARTVATGGGAGGGGAPFQLAIEPKANARQLSASTADAGALLLALDIDDKMQGGRLDITGRYDDAKPGNPLVGTAVIENFRIRNAPVLGRLLQAMTLYGLVEVVRGPGLGFTRMEAPFRYTGDVLELTDAKAFSASLGMTGKGRIDLGRQTADVTGTIVPAYFFNSLLGDIPLIGKLFSPEPGGGLFAATYAVHGPLDDPTVNVNPLAALTPGFLRGVFGLFGSASTPGAAPTQPRARPAR